MGSLVEPREVVALGQLTEFNLRIAQRQIEDSRKRGSRSQAWLQKGGELRVARAYELRAEKAELQAQKLAVREARLARIACNQARDQLKAAGIKARREEQARKKMVRQLYKEGLLIPPELEFPIPDPTRPQIEVETPQIESEYESEYGSEYGSERGSELE
ncbi:hypothetical protein VF21_08640 [Pseudogymnoascus sp. 05NY08]|nr:hypothetical protein VF21_08640 [Pseudogymnoascus sp. 05NY08]